MRERIQETLDALEREHDCRILFAVESGSRAWGFASPDSDYDIRAVYVKPLDWYLRLCEKPADTWSAMLPDDLDVVAWDLRKFLPHLAKSNAAVMEWLWSPIVYRDEGLLDRLASLKDRAANPVHIAHHYASMFRHAMEDRTEDGTIRIKKLCYALRANLCVQWALEHGTMPPTRFQEVVAGIDLPDDVRSAIGRLLAAKGAAKEADRVIPDSALAPVLADKAPQIAALRNPGDAADGRKLLDELDALFRSYALNERPSAGTPANDGRDGVR